jgi:hypothetical protein
MILHIRKQLVNNTTTRINYVKRVSNFQQNFSAACSNGIPAPFWEERSIWIVQYIPFQEHPFDQ